MEKVIFEIIDTTIHSFDFTFCAIVNIATYVFIKNWDSTYPKHCMSTWHKRVAFLVISILIGWFYVLYDSDIKVILNSIIVAPVSWSWIFKPICNKLNIDYDKNCNEECNNKEN